MVAGPRLTRLAITINGGWLPPKNISSNEPHDDVHRQEKAEEDNKQKNPSIDETEKRAQFDKETVKGAQCGGREQSKQRSDGADHKGPHEYRLVKKPGHESSKDQDYKQ